LVESWKQQHRKRKAITKHDPTFARSTSGTVSARLAMAPQASTRAGVKRSFSSLSSGSAPFSFDVDGDDGAKVAAVPASTVGKSEGRLTRDDWKAALTASLKARPAPVATKDGIRPKVADKLHEALRKAQQTQVGDGDLGARPSSDLAKLAEQIEEALHDQLRRNGSDADYMNKSRSIIFNLKDATNTSFGYRVLSGRLLPEALPNLTAEDMASESLQAQRAKMRKEAAEERELDWALRHGQVHTSGTFTCGKCKSTKTTYHQMQTRSSDEPMTTFVTCLNCKNRWKFC